MPKAVGMSEQMYFMADKPVPDERKAHCKNNGALEAASKTTIKTDHIQCDPRY